MQVKIQNFVEKNFIQICIFIFLFGGVYMLNSIQSQQIDQLQNAINNLNENIDQSNIELSKLQANYEDTTNRLNRIENKIDRMN